MGKNYSMSYSMLVSEIDIHDLVISYGLIGVSPKRFELSTLGLKERIQPPNRYKSLQSKVIIYIYDNNDYLKID